MIFLEIDLLSSPTPLVTVAVPVKLPIFSQHGNETLKRTSCGKLFVVEKLLSVSYAPHFCENIQSLTSLQGLVLWGVAKNFVDLVIFKCFCCCCCFVLFLMLLPWKSRLQFWEVPLLFFLLHIKPYDEDTRSHTMFCSIIMMKGADMRAGAPADVTDSWKQQRFRGVSNATIMHR